MVKKNKYGEATRLISHTEELTIILASDRVEDVIEALSPYVDQGWTVSWSPHVGPHPIVTLTKSNPV